MKHVSFRIIIHTFRYLLMFKRDCIVPFVKTVESMYKYVHVYVRFCARSHKYSCFCFRIKISLRDPETHLSSMSRTCISKVGVRIFFQLRGRCINVAKYIKCEKVYRSYFNAGTAHMGITPRIVTT